MATTDSKAIILLLFILLTACSPKIPNLDGYKITIVNNNKIIESNTTLVNKNETLYFTFTQIKISKLRPKIYMIGPINYNIYDIKNNIIASSLITSNTHYKLETLFRGRGEAIFLFIWESKYYTTKPIIINFRYYGE